MYCNIDQKRVLIIIHTASWYAFRPQTQIFFLEKFLVFSPKKFFLYFGKWNILAPRLKNSYTFWSLSPKKFIISFLKKIYSGKISYILLKNSCLIFRKWNFLVFRERYIQNPDIFIAGSIFRTLVYSEPEAFSEHCPTSMMGYF